MTQLLRRPKLLLSLLVLILAALAWFPIGRPPDVAIDPAMPGIGRATPVQVTVSEPRRGLSRVRVELIQGERSQMLADHSYEPRPFWRPSGAFKASEVFDLELGPTALPGLENGEAELRVTAERAPSWLRRPAPVVASTVLPVHLDPPSLARLSHQVYVAQGGSEAVVYRVGATATRDGVRVGEHWFPGYPLPGGGEGEHFAFFAVPHDFDEPGAIRLVAIDAVGNEALTSVVDRFTPKPLKTDTIRLSDAFMARVVPEILSRSPQVQGQGDLLADYLTVNRDLRRLNAEALEKLESRPELLWSRPFRQLPNTRTMASYADRRTYVYEGRDVDHQDHLGFDLASVRQAPVLASNRGVVALAEYFGIYGNTVVIDHGYGLMSLYAHLSDISVAVGDAVERGATVGRTGETGLAGGDHLHFSMLLHGMQINPLEWWDPHWLQDRIALKLGETFTFDLP